MALRTGMEFLSGLTGPNLLEHLQIMTYQEKEFTTGVMDDDMKDHG